MQEARSRTLLKTSLNALSSTIVSLFYATLWSEEARTETLRQTTLVLVEGNGTINFTPIRGACVHLA